MHAWNQLRTGDYDSMEQSKWMHGIKQLGIGEHYSMEQSQAIMSVGTICGRTVTLQYTWIKQCINQAKRCLSLCLSSQTHYCCILCCISFMITQLVYARLVYDQWYLYAFQFLFRVIHGNCCLGQLSLYMVRTCSYLAKSMNVLLDKRQQGFQENLYEQPNLTI